MKKLRHKGVKDAGQGPPGTCMQGGQEACPSLGDICVVYRDGDLFLWVTSSTGDTFSLSLPNRLLTPGVSWKSPTPPWPEFPCAGYKVPTVSHSRLPHHRVAGCLGHSLAQPQPGAGGRGSLGSPSTALPPHRLGSLLWESGLDFCSKQSLYSWPVPSLSTLPLVML